MAFFLWPSVKQLLGGIPGDLRQVPIARGLVDLDLCEVGGSEGLRRFWPHYMCLGGDREMGARGMILIQKVARYE